MTVNDIAGKTLNSKRGKETVDWVGISEPSPDWLNPDAFNSCSLRIVTKDRPAVPYYIIMAKSTVYVAMEHEV